MTTAALPSRARVVIIGGGVIGASVAYHLAGLGWTDLLLLEQGQLSCGTTWHPAGAVLHRAVRAARGGNRPVDRVPPVRRGDRRAHPGAADPAAPDGGHRR